MCVSMCKIKTYGDVVVCKDILKMMRFFGVFTAVIVALSIIAICTTWSTLDNRGMLCSVGIICMCAASSLYISKGCRSLTGLLRSANDERNAQARLARARELDQLPEVHAGSLSSSSSELDFQCVICLETVDSRARVIQLPCCHTFHPECIRAWLADPKHDRCPFRCPENPLTIGKMTSV
mmetsp:Transcript_56724/g.128241  ORF Transcript_56724/g.128241 Transcript_56724/m.128241 type:complete len:180 (+) Transcript_56724:3-542(+)